MFLSEETIANTMDDNIYSNARNENLDLDNSILASIPPIPQAGATATNPPKGLPVRTKTACTGRPHNNPFPRFTPQQIKTMEEAKWMPQQPTDNPQTS